MTQISLLSQAGKRFLSEKEVEAIYGVPVKTLQKWRLLKKGPAARKFGAAVRYPVTEIEAWLLTLPVVGGQLQAKH
jgi:predicted DNA-binding transcriptional regulator AlpA